MNSLIRRGILVLAAALALTVAVPAPAVASNITPVSTTIITAEPAAAQMVLPAYTIPDAASPPTASESDSASSSIVRTPSRTLNRWGEAAGGFHTKYDGFVGSQIVDTAQRTFLQSMSMVTGNWSYKASSELTQFAVRLNVIDGMGSTVDGIVKVFLNAILSVTGATGGGVLFGLLALLAVLFAVFRNVRRGGARMARQVGGVVLIVGIVFGVGMGAIRHDPGSEAGYNPSPLSPGWFVKGVNDTLTGMAALPARAFVRDVEGPVWGSALENSDRGGGLGCTAYTEAMKATLESSIAPKSSAGQSIVAIAGVMDSMWDSTGLLTWAKTQAGYNNPFAAKTYCRILDMRSGNGGGMAAYTTYIAAANATGWVNASGRSAAIRTDASTRAPFAPSNAENMMASIVAWAACEPTGFQGGRYRWKWESEWRNYQGGHEVFPLNARGWKFADLNANEECHKWWTASSEAGESSAGNQDIPKAFYVKGDIGWVLDRTKDASPSVRDFLVAVTGVAPGGATIGVVTYALGAVLSLIAFAVIAIIVIISKLFAAAFIISLWFVLIGAIFRPSEMKERLAKTANKFLGTAIFAALTTVVLTFVVVFTRALIRMGITIWGSGTIGSMIWSGLAPLLALYLTHIVFTKVFRLPSPVSIRGASAWSKSGVSGAMGVGVGAAAGSFAGTMLGNMARGALRTAGDNVLHKATGGRLGTAPRRGMNPVGGKSGDSVTGAASGRAETVDAGNQAPDAGELSPKEARKAGRDANREARKVDRADLREARKAYREEHGVAAKGDFLGAAAVASSRAAAFVGDKVRAGAAGLAQKAGLPQVKAELAARRDARRDAVAASKASAADRRNARKETKEKSTGTLKQGAATASTVMDSEESVAKRARWGVGGDVTGGALGFGVAAAGASVAAAGVAAGAAAGSVAGAMPRTGTATQIPDISLPDLPTGGRTPAMPTVSQEGLEPVTDTNIAPAIDLVPVMDVVDVEVERPRVEETVAPTVAAAVPGGTTLGEVTPTGGDSVSITPAQISVTDPVVAPATGGGSEARRVMPSAGEPTAAAVAPASDIPVEEIAGAVATGAATAAATETARRMPPIAGGAAGSRQMPAAGGARPTADPGSARTLPPRRERQLPTTTPAAPTTPAGRAGRTMPTDPTAPVGRADGRTPVKTTSVPITPTVQPAAPVQPAKVVEVKPVVPPTAAPVQKASAGAARVAKVLSAPADAMHTARTKLWRAQDATVDAAKATAESIVNNKRVIGARADAAIIRGAVQAGAEKVRATDLYQDSAAAAQRTGAVIGRGTRQVGAGASAVIHKRENDRELLAQFRAARMSGEGTGSNTSTATPEEG